MVQRTYQGINLGQQAAVAPRPAQGMGATQERVDTSPSIAGEALKAVLGVGVDLAKQRFQQSVQEHYLRGERAAAQGEAAEEVQADPFMAPFVRGGYNDATWRAQQAAFSNEMQQFIKGDGRKVSPEAFAEKLAASAGPSVADISKLSGKAQIEALAQQTKLEQALIGAQYKEHAKYKLDEAAQAYTMQGNDIANTMLEAQRAEDYTVLLQTEERAAQFVYGLMQDEKLPQELRGEIVTNYLTMMANADLRDVPEKLRMSGMLRSLTPEQLAKLDTEVRKSKNRTVARDNLGSFQYEAEFTAKLNAGEVTDVREMQGFVDFGIKQLGWSESHARSKWNAFFDRGTGAANTTAILEGVRNGDYTKLRSLLPPGSPVSAAVDIYGKELAKQGVPTPQRLGAQLKAGFALGSIPRSLGQDIAAAITQVGVSGGTDALNPELPQTLAAVSSAIDASGPEAQAVLLAAVPEQSRTALSYMLATRQFQDPVTAINTALAEARSYGSLTTEQKQQAITANRKAIREYVSDQVTNGSFKQSLQWMFGQQRSNVSDFNVGIWENAVMEELHTIAMDPMTISMMGKDGIQEAMLQQALASARARAIPVGTPDRLGGKRANVFMLPVGERISTVFPGLSDDDGVLLGQKLATFNPTGVQLPEDSTLAYRMGLGGFLNVYELDADGNEVRPATHQREGVRGVVSQDMLREVVNTVVQEKEAQWRNTEEANLGALVVPPGHSHGIVTDGQNNVGLPVNETFQWRKELLAAEGLRLQAYKDANGVAVGAARNVTGRMKVGDTITTEQAAQWFKEDSDAALNAAQAIALEHGVFDEQAIFGIAGMVYQHGEGGMREWKKTLETISDTDRYSYEDFAAEARKSKTWANPKTRKRVETFISKMRGHWQ